MTYKIADFAVEIHTIHPETEALCHEYFYETDKIDFSVRTTLDDIEKERQLSVAEFNGIVTNDVSLEHLAVYRKICAEILKFDAFLMHGVALEYDGEGYIFTAKSGTGKTTHVLQWKKHFGDDKVTIVNGDKPIIRFIDGKVYAYGTPWNGKEHFGTTGRTEVKALCFVDRGVENSIRELPTTEAVTRLFSQIMLHDSADIAKQLELVDMFFEKVPTYLLKCNISEEAAEVAYKGMKNAKVKNERN